MRLHQPAGAVMLACCLAGLPARAGATPPQDSSPPTTVGPTSAAPGPEVPPPYVPDLGPVPPAFPYDPDSGRQLVLDLRDARLVVFAAHEAVVDRVAAVPPLEVERRRLALRADLRRSEQRVAERAVARHRRQLELASLDEYVSGGRGDDLVSSVESMLSADSLMDLERARVFRGAQRDALDAARDEAALSLRLAVVGLDQAEAALADHDAELLAARHAVIAAQVAFDDATRRVVELESEQSEWLLAAARTAASPIMGPNALDVDDLVRKVHDADVTVRLTVPLEELAAMFLEEGEAEGVRGDVAFAQSILETGSFTNPATGSKVVFTDNNFAGIGACDSCEHGRVFRTAREGVRAQIQALRTYADPTVDSPDDYAHEMVLPKQLEWIRAGKTPTWYELTGKWATGAAYGLHIFDVYRDMYAMRTADDESSPTVLSAPEPAPTASAVVRFRVDALLGVAAPKTRD